MSLTLFDPLFDSSSLFAWPKLQQMERELGAVAVDKDGDFEYTCNFQGFRPSDIKVHHEGDHIIVEAESKHNGRHEHYERSLKRMVKLPDDVDKQNVRCEWNEKGEIVVRAHKLALDQPQKRTIPITFKKSDQSK
jgi:HSP20 family molecular chaperone IbpA